MDFYTVLKYAMQWIMMCVVSIHITVTLVHTKPGVAERFITDVARCTEEILKTPNAKNTGQVKATTKILSHWYIYLFTHVW